MTNGQPPRRPPPTPPFLDQVRPVEERYAPPPGQRAAPPRPGQYAHAQHAHPPQHPAYRHPGGANGQGGHPSHPPQPPAGRRPPPARQGSGLGGVLLFLLIGIGFILAAGAAFILLAPPTDLIREQAIALVKERTGRDLAIRGPANLTFYPSVGVSLKDVTLSAPPGMDGPPMVAMESLDISVKLMPLLSRRVEVHRLVLTRPSFDLRIDKSGRRNWDIAAPNGGTGAVRFAQAAAGIETISDAGTQAPLIVAQNGAPPPPATGRTGQEKLAALKDVVLDDVRVIDGRIAYSDARSGTSNGASAINMAINARTLASPMTAKGDLQWQGQLIRFDGTLTSLYEVLTQTPAKLAMNVSSAPLKAD